MKRIAIFLAGAASGALAVYWLSAGGCPGRLPEAVARDTVTIRDTLRVEVPVPSAMRPSVRYVTVRDTVSVRAEERVYEDSSFRAVVSGVAPRLDSITVYPVTRTVTVSVPMPVPVRRSPWGLGVSAGVAVTPGGISPAVSVGVTYTFKSF
ncbi:MAG: hypothetical protein K2F86_07200 [Duncaniella sp.]|nr:hypothetical protein [Duncaniella sp.]